MAYYYLSHNWIFTGSQKNIWSRNTICICYELLEEIYKNNRIFISMNFGLKNNIKQEPHWKQNPEQNQTKHHPPNKPISLFISLALDS